ncbi:MAG: hypothetical protein KY475_21455 [Planctomycetes bacterium]|nr:hypothetical protein [Planctomycetota bacterium]
MASVKKMAERRTFASVTDTPCTCGCLERAADDSRNPIVFDEQTGEYHFQYKLPPHTEPALLVIYHCPFCGGAAPESKRKLLFALIPPEEERRLMARLAAIGSISDALETLGEPAQDTPSVTHRHEQDGQPPSIQHHRTLVYENLSEVAEVWITERPDGAVACRLQGKYIGHQRPGART